MKNNEKMENLKEWNDTVKEKLTTHKRYTEEEFTYPMWFKFKKSDLVVRFDSANQGQVIISDSSHTEGNYHKDWTIHTKTDLWQQVENPNLATDKEIEQVINEEYEKDNSINNGGKTDVYQLPNWVKDCDDFAEWRKLNGFQFNIIKAGWTFNTQRHTGTNALRDINKIIHYANREKQRILKELEK